MVWQSSQSSIRRLYSNRSKEKSLMPLSQPSIKYVSPSSLLATVFEPVLIWTDGVLCGRRADADICVGSFDSPRLEVLSRRKPTELPKRRTSHRKRLNGPRQNNGPQNGCQRYRNIPSPQHPLSTASPNSSTFPPTFSVQRLSPTLPLSPYFVLSVVDGSLPSAR